MEHNKNLERRVRKSSNSAIRLFKSQFEQDVISYEEQAVKVVLTELLIVFH